MKKEQSLMNIIETQARMKVSIFVTLFSVLCVFNSFAQPCGLVNIPTQNLVGYWPFCGNANDESGNGNDGVVNGATLTEDRFGNSATAYAFDGIDDFISSTDINLSNEFTISCWVKPIGDNGALVDKSYDQEVNSGYTLIYNNSGNGLYGHVGWSNVSENNIYPTEALPLEIDEWSLCQMVVNNGMGQIYLNGELRFETTGLNNTSQSGGVLVFGRSLWGGNFFTGNLDDIGIWNRALTPAEITSLYIGEPVVQPVCAELDPALQNGLVGYWPFCGNANDESGNGNDGVVEGAINSTDRFGNPNAAYTFDGVDDAIEVPAVSDLMPSNISISCWINTPPGGGGHFIRSRFYGYKFVQNNLDLAVTFQLHHNVEETDWTLNTNPSPSWNYNEWHSVVGTFDGSMNRLYIDGVLVGELSAPTPYIIYSSDGLIVFGRDGNTGAGASHFLGTLDDIGIWNRALTPAEITSLYTGEPVVQPVCAELDPALQNGLVGYWPFCGNANDESGNGLNGVLMEFNGVGYQENPNIIASLGLDRFGNSLSALATTTYASNVEIPVSSALFENEFTISLWAKNDSAVSLYPTIVESENFNFVIQYGNTGGPVSIGSYMNGLAVTPFGGVYSPINFQEWSLITVVNENFQNKFYINGVLMDTSDDSTTLQGNAPGSFIRIGNGLQLPQEAFYGLIDDVTIHNRALTPAEITSLYTGEPVVQPLCAELDPALQNGLVGYWPFCGNANDESGNGNDGNNNGAVLTADRFGNTNSAFQFLGSEWIDVASNPSFNVGANSFTLSCWAKREGSNQYQHLVTRNEISVWPNSLGSYALRYEDSGVALLGSGDPFTNNGSVYAESPFDLSQWNHIVGLYNAEDNTLSIFINGEFISSSFINPNAISYDNNGGLFFGVEHPTVDLPSGPQFFTGTLDDIGIWNRALTPAEITSLYTGEPVVQPVCAELDPALQNGLVGYWPFCGNANDESGNGNDGVVNGAFPTEDRFGNDGSAFFFDGDSFIDLTNTSVAVQSNLPRSISCWVLGFLNGRLVSTGSPVPSGAFNAMVQDSHFWLMAYDNDFYPTTGFTMQEWQWYHLSVTYENGEVKTYINGVLDNVGALEINTVGQENYIGKSNDPSQPSMFFGVIDDVLIHNRALTQEEIQLLYGDFEPTTGCTNTNACNFIPSAITDDASCVLPNDPCDDGNPNTANDTFNSVCQCAGNTIGVDCSSLEGSLQDGLIGYWPFCGNANDASDTGNDGVVYEATMTEDRFGNTMSAYHFDGNNDFIEVSHNEIYNQMPITMSVWVRSAEEDNTAIFVRKYCCSSWNGWTMGVYDATIPSLEFAYYLSPCFGVYQTYCSPEPFISNGLSNLFNGSWHHLAFVVDSTGGTMYFNGIAVHQQPWYDNTGNPTDLAAAVSSNWDLVFGGHQESSTYFNGDLDDIGIWNRALTTEEVALLYGNFTLPVAGCTDPIASNYDPLATVNEGCEYTTTVQVFNDLNGNGIHEENEPGLGNWPVLVNNLNILLWTNANGFVYLPLPSGVQELEVLNPTDNWIITTSPTAMVDFSTGVSTASFGLQVIPGEAIVIAGPYQGFWEILHCTDGYESGVYLENIGSQTVSGYMTLTCDPLFTPDADSYFTTPPVETGPGYAMWNVEEFMPGEFELLSFHIDGPGVDYIGQFFNFEFNLNLFDPQGNMILNQTWNVTPQVACAYDPNDITGFPEFLPTGSEGYDSPRYILPGHEVLFVVRFQNTGNYPAEDVKIDIPLDPTKWDIGEFSPLHASALDMGCLHDDGTYDLIVDSNQVVIKFVFEDIYLPDSVSNEEASHGFAAFRIKARNDLAHNTELNAQAFIYFDENPAVVTNQTLHTIFDCESFSSIVGQDVVCASDSISLDATQPFVDTFTWVLNNEVVSTASTFIYPAETGNYSVVLTTSNALCDIPDDAYEPEAHTYSVVVNPLPSAEVTTEGGVLTAVDGVAWQWSIDGIAADTTPSIVASQNGMYTVEITNEFGCSVVSDSLAITSGITNIDLQASINVYPNPMNAQARIELPKGLFDIEIFDQTGACVRSLPGSQGVVIVERASLVTGIYHLQIRSEEGKQHIRLVVE